MVWRRQAASRSPWDMWQKRLSPYFSGVHRNQSERAPVRIFDDEVACLGKFECALGGLRFISWPETYAVVSPVVRNQSSLESTEGWSLL